MADKMSIDTKPPNPDRDESEESTGSTPEREQNPSMTAGSGSNIINVSQDGQQPKRKGGRKPVSTVSIFHLHFTPSQTFSIHPYPSIPG